MQRFDSVHNNVPKGPSPKKVLITVASLLVLVTVGFYLFLRFSSVNKTNRSAKNHATDLPYSKVGDSAPKVQVERKTASSARDQFTLEVKACATRAEAENIVEGLASKSVNAYYTPLQTEDGHVIYRVRLGLFPSLAMAEKVSSQIRKEQNINNQIVKLQ